LRCPSGEGELRLDDLLEEGIFRRLLLHYSVIDFELALKDRIGRLVELVLVRGLQLDLVL
jgi:hypothetical protein